MTNTIIKDVSDTALWVAVYRAKETERADALFRDPLAGVLAGERGKQIAKQMGSFRATAWTIVIRTCIIDSYIKRLITEGVDTVINLGCGLDTRPYRLSLPPTLRWVEVDFPHIIALKEEQLAREKPQCHLERISLDLSDAEGRKQLFSKLNSVSKKALILTEGVTPYLSNEEVAALAEDLRQQPNFLFWIVDYYPPHLLKYFLSKKRLRQMRNAPFRFRPPDWFAFFAQHGWQKREIRYTEEESAKLGRPMPLPILAKMLLFIFGPLLSDKFKRSSAYVLLERK
ncbi:MAG: class I SAM-dependent methyltransferase [Pseudobdellovibrionaceae bacterium]